MAISEKNELKERRKAVIERSYKGDAAAYMAWAKKTFSSSDFPTTHELNWLRGQTTDAPIYVEPLYPG